MAKIVWAEGYPPKNHFHHPRNHGPAVRIEYSMAACEEYIRAEVAHGDIVEVLTKDRPEPYQCDGILPQRPHGSLMLKCRLHFKAADGTVSVVETEEREVYSRKICDRCDARGVVHNPKAEKHEHIAMTCPRCKGKGEID